MRNVATVAARPADEFMLRVWVWLSVHRRVRMALAAWCVLTLCWFVNVTIANAAEMDMSSGVTGTFMLPLGHLTDTSGVPLHRYSELPIRPGNATTPVQLIRAIVLNILWAFYAVCVFLVLAILEFILSFMWLDWLASPIGLIANSLDGILGQFGLVGLGLSVTAVTVAFAVLRGRKGSALVEVLVVSAVVGLIATPMGNPINELTGEESVLKQSAAYGAELGQGTTQDASEGEDGGGSDDEAGVGVSSGLVDMTLRAPAQMISFGQELEGECKTAFDEAAKDPGVDTEKWRKKVISCDKGVKEANETSSFTAFGFYFMNWFSLIGLVVLIVVLVFFLIKDVLMALFGSINVIIKGYLAAFPGPARFAFFNAFMQVVVNVVMIAIYVWALHIYLWIINMVARSMAVAPLMLVAMFFGFVVIVMAVTFFLMKGQAKKAGKKLSEVMSNMGLNRAAEPKPGKISMLGNAAGAAGLSAAGRAGKSGLKSAGRKLLASRAVAGAAGVATGGAATMAMTGAAAATSAARKARAAKAAPAALPSGTAGGRAAPAPLGAGARPSGALEGEHIRQRAVPVGGSYMPEPEPTPPPQRPETPMAGRMGGQRVHHNGRASTLDVVEGEIVDERDVPRSVRAAASWGGKTSFRTPGTENLRKARSGYTAAGAPSNMGGRA